MRRKCPIKPGRLLAVTATLYFCNDFARGITIDTVPVGNSGNPADMRYLDVEHPNGTGSVANPYRIGKTEVTNVQYAAFLNAVAKSDPYGLYNASMSIARTGSS